ncbi:MAG: Holliday junction resolvase [Pseudomonas sp.]|nr:Holliday junction resolvase [Pseudomonas sp.]
MRILLFIVAALAWTTQAQAFDTTTESLVASGFVTSKVTSAPFDRKLIVAAQDDAAAFIASDGQLRGARLESALLSLREELHQTQPKLCVSDFELAQAILVQ